MCVCVLSKSIYCLLKTKAPCNSKLAYVNRCLNLHFRGDLFLRVVYFRENRGNERLAKISVFTVFDIFKCIYHDVGLTQIVRSLNTVSQDFKSSSLFFSVCQLGRKEVNLVSLKLFLIT